MTPLHRGILVAVAQCLIVLSLAGKYAVDRERLPRVWFKTAPVDPNMPIRGRYVSLRLIVDGPESIKGVTIIRRGNEWVLVPPVAFFIPEHAKDPSRRLPGEELWVQASLPKSGMPRPVQLGIKKDGVLLPIVP